MKIIPTNATANWWEPHGHGWLFCGLVNCYAGLPFVAQNGYFQALRDCPLTPPNDATDEQAKEWSRLIELRILVDNECGPMRREMLAKHAADLVVPVSAGKLRDAVSDYCRFLQTCGGYCVTPEPGAS